LLSRCLGKQGQIENAHGNLAMAPAPFEMAVVVVWVTQLPPMQQALLQGVKTVSGPPPIPSLNKHK
jgi:hypothetical protein